MRVFAIVLLLGLGSKSWAFDVRKLQYSLYELGYDLAVDGVLGNETMRELKIFFEENSYEFDGEITAKVISDFYKLKSQLLARRAHARVGLMSLKIW